MEKAIASLEKLLYLLNRDLEEEDKDSAFGEGYLFGVKACIKRLQNEKKERK